MGHAQFIFPRCRQRLRGEALRRAVRMSGRLLFLTVVASTIFAEGAAGQIRVMRAPRPQLAREAALAVIQPSEEATNLLRRADEGIEREDWKLVIDSLQRIVELPGEHVLTSDNRIYESARRHAHRRIATLPPAGLQAYRLVHDGEAAALLAKGVEKHDPALLRTVVDKYICTRAGDDAAVTLSDWLIDEGRFSEGAALLHQVQSIYPDSDIAPWVIRTRLAICSAAMGQRERAQDILKSTTQPSASAPAAGDQSDLEATMATDRLREIGAYIESVARDDGAAGIASWPVMLGSLARDGKLPAVEPTFIDYPPWEEDLLAAEPKFEFSRIREYAARQKLLPVRQVVTDGKLLVVKGDIGLLAWDVDSFTRVWTSKGRDELAVNENKMFQPSFMSSPENLNQTDAQLRNEPQVVRMLHDSVGSDVTIASNLALTVEWAGDPPPVLLEHPNRHIPGRDVFSVTHPNRIAAYSLEDGSLVWKNEISARGPDQPVGNARDPRNLPGHQQPQNEVEFLAAPIPVENVLLAPCRINSDLFAALLDPETGKIVRQIYLCGTGGGLFDSLYALRPCVADGAVFIPTGRGLLVAVQTSDWSVRWAVRYETLAETAASGGWLSNPVIAVGDVVLLAPGDSDFLFCVDRGTGELRWKTPREDFLYVVGANDTHIWTAGSQLQMLEVETGRPMWRAPIGEPCGRGSIIGQRIYLPITGGVKIVNAVTGEDVPMQAPVVPPALGNIFAWEGSVYSVAVDKIRKYPDLGEGYRQAVARHNAEPADASRAIRLACLELLKNQPNKALAALATVPDLRETNKRQHTHVVHLRVRSMLDMVSGGELNPDEALKVLSDARQIALSREDAIESSLALGEYLRRREKFLDASLQYLTLVLSEEGDQMIASESGIQHRARGLAVQRIAQMSKDLPASDKKVLEARLQEWLTEAIRQREQKSLLWLAESAGLSELVYEAGLVLGNWAAADLRSEQAESYYLRVMHGSATPERIAEAAIRLAALSLDADELHQPVTAQKLLDRLQREFANATVPERAATPQADALEGGGTTPVGRLAEQLRARINPAVLNQHQTAMKPVMLGKPGGPHSVQIQFARPLSMRGERIEPLCDKMLLLLDNNNETNRVEAYELKQGKVIWPAELRLLGDLAVEPRQPIAVGMLPNGARSDVLGRGRFVANGQTMVVNSAYGVHAIGMLTGRRLWSRPFDPPASVSQDPSGSDTWIWANDGYLVSVDSRGHLDVAYMNQGDRVLWRCSKPERRWAAVRSRGPYVVAVDSTLQQIDVFLLSDGRYQGEFKFTQDPSPLRQVNISLYDDVICGPVGTHEVAALELATPGVERWRIKTLDAVAQIFKPRPDLLAIADRSGGVQIIDPVTGKKLMETKVSQCTHGVNDGALIDGILYVYGYQARVFDAGEFEKQVWAMAAIRMDSGQVLWQVGDLDARTYFSDEIFRASSNAIPLAVFLAPNSPRAQAARTDNGNLQAGAVELALLDKATGKLIGDKVFSALNNESGATRILDVSVWPDQVVVVAGLSYMFFPAAPLPQGISLNTNRPARLPIRRPIAMPASKIELNLDELRHLGNPLPLQAGARALSNIRDAFLGAFDDGHIKVEEVEEVEGVQSE